MILYRASNLAEVTGIPEHVVEEIGLIQLVGLNVRVTLCGSSEIAGGGKLLVPRCDIFGSAADLPRNVLCVNRALADVMFGSVSEPIVCSRMHH